MAIICDYILYRQNEGKTSINECFCFGVCSRIINALMQHDFNKVESEFFPIFSSSSSGSETLCHYSEREKTQQMQHSHWNVFTFDFLFPSEHTFVQDCIRCHWYWMGLSLCAVAMKWKIITHQEFISFIFFSGCWMVDHFKNGLSNLILLLYLKESDKKIINITTTANMETVGSPREIQGLQQQYHA